MKVFDFSLEHIRITGKDLVVVIGFVWMVFELYTRFLALESGQLEIRISQLNMELSYLEGRERSEADQRKYELKKEFVKDLHKKLEALQ